MTTAAIDRDTEFVTLLEPLRHALWRFAMRVCWDEAAAEDCVQDAILIAYRKFDTFTPGTSFKAWIFRISTNVIRNENTKTARRHRRQKAVENLDSMAVVESNGVPEVAVDDPEAVLELVSDGIRQAVKTLPPRKRMVFLLRAAEGFRYREIADLMDIPIGTVMSDLFRARVELRLALTDYARTSGFAKTAA